MSGRGDKLIDARANKHERRSMTRARVQTRRHRWDQPAAKHTRRRRSTRAAEDAAARRRLDSIRRASGSCNCTSTDVGVEPIVSDLAFIRPLLRRRHDGDDAKTLRVGARCGRSDAW